jgi:hypothetical protein
MTVTTNEAEHRSAYPEPVDKLVSRARAMAAQLGELPSQRKLMAELRIGKPKARVVLDALQAGAGRLHLVEAAEQARPAGEAPSEPERPADTEPPTSAEPAPVPAEPTADVPAERPAVPVVSGRERGRQVSARPLLLLVFPAMVAIWAGWVGLGSLTGFGVVHPLPGIADHFTLNTAITLPVGVETYAAFALRVWLSGRVPVRAKRFARWSVVSSLAVGALGQITYHLMTAAHVTSAPWPITTLVSCLPVAVLGMGAALAHLLNEHDDD